MHTTDSVSVRYAQALFETANAAGRLDPVLAQLEELAQCLQQHPRLRELLLNPDVETGQKLGVCAAALSGGWQEDVQAFVRVVLSFGRAALLLEMAEALRRLVDEERRIARVVVRSARPLPEPLRAQLVAALERSEGRRVTLMEETAPELIGGVQVMIGNRMMDGSLKGRLADLRQRLTSVRV